MGRRLGLSTLVVILSLLFWFYVWGPVGALLAVPLTMVVKIMLENTEDLRWVAILLDKSPPQAGVGYAVAQPAASTTGGRVGGGSLDRPNMPESMRKPDGGPDSTAATGADVELA